MQSRGLALLACVFSTLVLGCNSAAARTWKASELEAAQDYLQVEHGIAGGQQVQIWWIAPQFLENKPDMQEVRVALGDYILVGLLHFSYNDNGVVENHLSTLPIARYSGAGDLKPVADKDLSLIMSTFVHAFGKVLKDGLGALGNAMQFYVFDGSGVDSCASEKVLWIDYLGESYSFKTPLPGCD